MRFDGYFGYGKKKFESDNRVVNIRESKKGKSRYMQQSYGKAIYGGRSMGITVTTEKQFESDIEAFLVSAESRYTKGNGAAGFISG